MQYTNANDHLNKSRLAPLLFHSNRMSDFKRFVLVLEIIWVLLAVPVQCAYYCYYYYNYYYSRRRQYCYYYYDYYYYYYNYSSYSSSAGVIAGAVIGGIVGVLLISTIVVCVCVKLCQKTNHGQVLVYPQQPVFYTSSDTQQGYPQPSAPVAYPYPPPPYSSGQQVFSYNG